MNKADFLVDLEDILQREEACFETDDLNSYEEWDSLSKMAVMAYFSKNFKIQIDINKFDSINKVSDLVHMAGENISD